VRHVEDRLLCPLHGAAVGLAYSFLAIDVRGVVGKQKVVVAAVAKESLENAPFLAVVRFPTARNREGR
jgi:hypothetical protein